MEKQYLRFPMMEKCTTLMVNFKVEQMFVQIQEVFALLTKKVNYLQIHIPKKKFIFIHHIATIIINLK